MNTHQGISRRHFMRFLGGTAFLTSAPWIGKSRRADARTGPNDKIICGLVGCGGQGTTHLRTMLKNPEVELAAVCDVYRPRAEEAANNVGEGCQAYQDYRRILDRDDIDCIFCATPDHWHTLISIHACQAWKDVYVEKPLSTTIYEGRQIVENARRYDRIVQVGLQQRSIDIFQNAVDIVQKGKVGTITTARSWIGPNGYRGFETPGNPPEGLDWDLWLGPAPWVPYSPQRFGAFRAFHDYASGELTNWGPHLMDIAQWGIGQDRPLRIQATGNSRDYSGADDYEVMDILFEFQGCNLTWQQAYNLEYVGKTYGTMFIGTQGKLMIDRQSYVVQPDSLGIPEGKPEQYEWVTVKTHHDNFFQCMRTRELPNCDIEIGHRTTSTCLLGHIALKCHRTLNWEGDTERFLDDEAANRYLHRPYRAPWHL